MVIRTIRIFKSKLTPYGYKNGPNIEQFSNLQKMIEAITFKPLI